LLDGTDVLARAHAPAEIWECPQLFRLGNRWILVVSLIRDEAFFRVAYLVGDLDVSDGAPRFRPVDGGLVDHGHDFYAPAVLVEDDRVLLWGWSWEDRDPHDVVSSRWAGVLTWPRELYLDDGGRLASRPAGELHGLRRESLQLSLSGDGHPAELPDGPLDLELRVEGSTTLELHHGAAGLKLDVDVERRRVVLTRPTSDPVRSTWPTEGTVAGDGPVELRVVLDGSVVELYVGDGPVFTERVQPPGEGAWLLFASGAAEGELPVTVHLLRSALET
jgi:beta-fructofuranosidase